MPLFSRGIFWLKNLSDECQGAVVAVVTAVTVACLPQLSPPSLAATHLIAMAIQLGTQVGSVVENQPKYYIAGLGHIRSWPHHVSKYGEVCFWRHSVAAVCQVRDGGDDNRYRIPTYVNLLYLFE